MRRYRLLAPVIRRVPATWLAAVSRRDALKAVHFAAERSQAYRVLLQEAGLTREALTDPAAFTTRVPVLHKATTFARFPVEALAAVPLTPEAVRGVLTSSGQGGRFAFGVLTRGEARRATALLDLGLDQAFGVFSRSTLLINCLPMGVGFTSEATTVAQTSVREDMVLALARNLGPSYAQLLLVGDPFFLKRVVDVARAEGLDWRPHRVHVVLGEETFGEHYRSYLAQCLGNDPDAAEGGFVGSSMGVGELGLNLFFETRGTVALRRLAAHDAEARQLLFGDAAVRGLPMLFVWNPLRTFVEVLDADGAGFGRLTVTMLGPQAVPLPRYATGDTARLVPPEALDALRRRGHRLAADLGALPLLALAGREQDALPGGLHVAQFKEALFADRATADALTGAFRLERAPGGLTWHVQLREGVADAVAPARVLAAAAPGGATTAVRLHAFREYPWALGVDYERKLTYWAG